MNMICCGQVVDTIRRDGDKYELLVDFGVKGSDLVPDYYIEIKYCPFCGMTLEFAQAFYNTLLEQGCPPESIMMTKP